MTEPLLNIKIVAQQTGLSPHVIRVWEKRYGVVTPQRSQTRRRLYSHAEVEHLGLLARLTKQGHAISALAGTSLAALRQLAANAGPASAAPAIPPAAGAIDYLEAGFDAVRRHDQAALEEILMRAELALGRQGMLVKVAAPFAQQLGQRWREGDLSAAHEHFASAVLRGVLSRARRGFARDAASPVLVVATPAGQLHELGALLAVATASNLGWHVIYLGPSLPASEIAGAAIQHQARAVGLSLVYPEDDAALPDELRLMRRLLPAATAILVGGRAYEAYGAALREINAQPAPDLDTLGRLLDRLRRVAP